MKTLNSLFVALFIVSLIAACDSSTGVDNTEAEGTRIGTWMVYPDKADWVGSSGAAKLKTTTINAVGDTINYTEPVDRAISLVHNGGDLALRYVDSTITAAELEANWVDMDISSNSRLLAASEGVAGWLPPDSIYFTERKIIAECDSAGIDNETLFIDVHDVDHPDYEQDDNVIIDKVITLEVAGMDSTSKHLLACPSG